MDINFKHSYTNYTGKPYIYYFGNNNFSIIPYYPQPDLGRNRTIVYNPYNYHNNITKMYRL